MKLRKHQQEFLEVCQNIVKNNDVKDVLLNVYPGGGKSLIPSLAASTLIPNTADCVCWITPRVELKHQGVQQNSDFVVSQKYSKECKGWVTCYHSLPFNLKNYIERFKTKKHILILDECHHLNEDGIWTEYVRKLKELSVFTIFMSGTLERGDSKKIFGMHYTTKEQKVYIDASSMHYIEYSLESALEEKAIIPPIFNTYDASDIVWVRNFSRKSSSTLTNNFEIPNDSLHTVLKTEFAFELIREGLNNFEENYIEGGKCLIIAPDTSTANKYESYVKEISNRKVSVINYRKTQSHNFNSIHSFKHKDCDILITVFMAYEGLDIPEITHSILLTRIRSKPWLIQCINRATRNSKKINKISNYIFAPSDFLLNEVIDSMRCDSLIIEDTCYDLGETYRKRKKNNFIPISSMLVSDVCVKEQKNYDIESLRNEFIKLDCSILEFCRLKGFSVYEGRKILKGLLSSRYRKTSLSKKEKENVKNLFLEALKENPKISYETFYNSHKENLYGISQSSMRNLLVGISGMSKFKYINPPEGFDRAEVQKHFDSLGMNFTKYSKKYFNVGPDVLRRWGVNPRFIVPEYENLDLELFQKIIIEEKLSLLAFHKKYKNKMSLPSVSRLQQRNVRGYTKTEEYRKDCEALIDDFKASGLTVYNYCKLKNVSWEHLNLLINGKRKGR